MLLKQEFKTLEGAAKRARFENAHSAKHWFRVVRCRTDGNPDPYPYDHTGTIKYVWRLSKERRT